MSARSEPFEKREKGSRHERLPCSGTPRGAARRSGMVGPDRLGEHRESQGVLRCSRRGRSPDHHDPGRRHLRHPLVSPGRDERQGRRHGRPLAGDGRPPGEGGPPARPQAPGRDPVHPPQQGRLRLYRRSAPGRPRARRLRLLARRSLGRGLALARRRLVRRLPGSPPQVGLALGFWVAWYYSSHSVPSARNKTRTNSPVRVLLFCGILFPDSKRNSPRWRSLKTTKALGG